MDPDSKLPDRVGSQQPPGLLNLFNTVAVLQHLVFLFSVLLSAGQTLCTYRQQIQSVTSCYTGVRFEFFVANSLIGKLI